MTDTAVIPPVTFDDVETEERSPRSHRDTGQWDIGHRDTGIGRGVDYPASAATSPPAGDLRYESRPGDYETGDYESRPEEDAPWSSSDVAGFHQTQTPHEPAPPEVPTADPVVRSTPLEGGDLDSAPRHSLTGDVSGVRSQEPVDATAEADDGDPPDEPSAQPTSPAVNARLARLTTDVMVVDGRPRYHLAGCVHLIGREVEPLPVGEAVELGFTPCALCDPNPALLAD